MVKEQIEICGNVFQTRIILPPLATGKSSPEGFVTEEILAHYDKLAQNPNISMIITEHAYISDQGKASNCQMSVSKDEDIEGLKKLADTIHKYGKPVIMQVNHAGSATSEDVTGQKVVGPSAVVNVGRKAGVGAVVPEALTVSEIEDIKMAFVDAAKRAMEAGFDGVQVHSAHGYLLNQFYSPITNKRTDEYTGSTIEGRTKLQIAIIKEVRDAIGDKILSVRLGGCDYSEDGSTIEDAVRASILFEQAGADIIDLSGGMCRYIRPNHNEPGYYGDMSEEVKKAVKIPVVLTGGVKTMDQANELLKADKADLIGVGRALLQNYCWEM